VSAAPREALGEALAAALALETVGPSAGNVTIARGAFEGRAVRSAFVENRAASGSIGVAEAERLAALFHVCATERSPLVLFLDSAGAKVSEGLAALGGFRTLFRAGLEAASCECYRNIRMVSDRLLGQPEHQHVAIGQ